MDITTAQVEHRASTLYLMLLFWLDVIDNWDQPANSHLLVPKLVKLSSHSLCDAILGEGESDLLGRSPDVNYSKHSGLSSWLRCLPIGCSHRLQKKTMFTYMVLWTPVRSLYSNVRSLPSLFISQGSKYLKKSGQMFNPFLGVMTKPSSNESWAKRFIFLDATDQSLCTVWLFNKQCIDLALDSLFVLF